MEKGNLLVLALQVLLILMLLASYARFFVAFSFFLSVQVLLSGAYFFVLFFQARKQFREQFLRFIVFFGGLWVFIQLFWALEETVRGAEKLNYLVGLLFLLVVFFIVFRLIAAKSCPAGKVLSSDGKITVVETGFDLMSFSRAGKHVIETPKKYKAGSKVKLKLSQSGFWKKKLEIIE